MCIHTCSCVETHKIKYGEIRLFLEKSKLRKFITTKPELQNILRGILSTEKEEHFIEDNTGTHSIRGSDGTRKADTANLKHAKGPKTKQYKTRPERLGCILADQRATLIETA